MRCFIALELPDHVRNRLIALQESLGAIRDAVRWTRLEQIHLTLKFLGEVPDADVAGLCTAIQVAASRGAPFDLQIGGTGCFPPHGPERIVWAGVPNPPAELFAIQKACEDACAPFGYPPEARAYSPHLTIGRTRDRARRPGRIRAAVTHQASWRAGSFTVQELIVFQSVLGPGGSRYIPLSHARLGAEAQAAS